MSVFCNKIPVNAIHLCEKTELMSIISYTLLTYHTHTHASLYFIEGHSHAPLAIPSMWPQQQRMIGSNTSTTLHYIPSLYTNLYYFHQPFSSLPCLLSERVIVSSYIHLTNLSFFLCFGFFSFFFFFLFFFLSTSESDSDDDTASFFFLRFFSEKSTFDGNAYVSTWKY